MVELMPMFAVLAIGLVAVPFLQVLKNIFLSIRIRRILRNEISFKYEFPDENGDELVINIENNKRSKKNVDDILMAELVRNQENLSIKLETKRKLKNNALMIKYVFKKCAQ